MSDLQYRAFRDAEASLNIVSDPGDGGTIDPNRFFDGVCELDGGGLGTQTRRLAAASAFPVGTKLTLVKKAGVSPVSVSQAGTLAFGENDLRSVTLSEIGAAVLVEVLRNSAGNKAWRAIARSSAPASGVLADPGDAGSILMGGVTDGICVVADADDGAETRILPLASTLPLGSRLTVVYGDGDEGITITQPGSAKFTGDESTSIVLNIEGNSAVFVVASAGGNRLWRLLSLEDSEP